MKTFAEVLEMVRNLTITESCLEVPNTIRAYELLDECRKAGIPFEITHIENLGPFQEAGCSPHSFRMRVSVRCPNGVVVTSNAYEGKALLIAASRMLD